MPSSFACAVIMLPLAYRITRIVDPNIIRQILTLMSQAGQSHYKQTNGRNVLQIYRTANFKQNGNVHAMYIVNLV